jgi:hypothetical protein
MSVKMRKHTSRAQDIDLFMDGCAEDFPADSVGGKLAASLKEELANLSALAVARSAGTSKRRQGTAGRRDARETLRALAEAVADTSKSIARERPEIQGLFDLKGKDRSDATLVATARAFADAAAPFVGIFVEYGLSATIVSDLRERAGELDRSISLQAEGAGAGVTTTAAAEESYQRLADLAERLDPVVRNRYRGNQVKITAWEHARRLESAPHAKGDGNTPPATPPDKA